MHFTLVVFYPHNLFAPHTHITCLSLTFLCVFHLALHTFRLLLSSSVIPPSQLTPSNDLLANYFEVLPAVSRLTLPLFPAPRQSLAAVQKLPNSFPKQTFSMCVCPHAGVCVCMLAASVANQFKSFSVAVAWAKVKRARRCCCIIWGHGKTAKCRRITAKWR